MRVRPGDEKIVLSNEMNDTDRVSGLVKWFDPVKGFGFVVSGAGGPDILLHVNVLRDFGQNSVAEASRIVVDVQNTERGVQALEVITLEPPEGIEDDMTINGEPADANTFDAMFSVVTIVICALYFAVNMLV